MIYSALPESNVGNYKTVHKKHISVITPDKILGNEKLILGLMYTAMAAVLLTWAVRKG